jgi:hypothetical protein
MRSATLVLATASGLVLALAVALVSTSAHADEGAGAGELTESRAQVDASLVQMRATSMRVREQLRTARKRGTRLQITCVDEALSRSDVALRRARELGDEAVTAYARGDADAARAAMRRMSELKEAQRAAAASATACSPAPIVVATSGTTVKLEVSKAIAPPQ